ncbi:hypothetical protein IP90_00291 [Luteimonas cucumeris]|uniref:Outer membrane protein with beta-barrel domain n=1 Tax=Luteimonas cucumeris TaxID=985012 RepID=A0A562LEB6_9GAMM|nr:hypothetical protein IP90_00291 [Luteimonas cucumeris]
MNHAPVINALRDACTRIAFLTTRSSDLILKKTTLALGLAGALAALPAQADDDRFVFRIGAMHADAQGTLSAGTQFAGQPYRFEQDFDFGGAELVPRGEGLFKFGDRHRLLFNYFNYDKDRRETLDQAISFDDITIPAGSFAKAEAQFELAGAVYDYAVVETPTTSLGLQIGVQYAKLEARLHAEAGPYRYQDRAGDDSYAPVVGLRWTASPNDRWRFVVQGQYLNADWGNFGDYEGDISRANAIAEYRFTERFGVHLGYDWFRIDANRSGRDGMLGLDQRFKGPIAGVTFAF